MSRRPPYDVPADGVDETLSLAPTANSVGQARRFVQTVLEDAGCGAWADSTALVVSELVTNAVIHARTLLDVRIVVVPDGVVRVEVHDRSDRPPRTKHYSATSGTGRGLLLVEALARDWGMRAAPDGKIVWAEMAPDAGGSGAAALGTVDRSSRNGAGEPAPAWNTAFASAGPSVVGLGWVRQASSKLGP